MSRFFTKAKWQFLLFLAAALLVGAALAGIDRAGSFMVEWLAAAVLVFLGLAAGYAAFRWTGAGRAVVWMVVLAFLLRLASGIALEKLLPLGGYAANECQNAGYVYFDACHRDAQAWGLAKSNQPLWSAFTADFANDQYGGLLSLSALVYRYLSPDQQRPLLIVLLGAIIAALGIPFLWDALRSRWGEGTAGIAGWILALYPESILLGSSQMREPFLITLIALAFWGVVVWKQKRGAAAFALVISAAGLCLISWRVGLPVAAMILMWVWLDDIMPRLPERWKAMGWVGLGLAALAIVGVMGAWLVASAQWDIHLAVLNSGWVQRLTEPLGKYALVPFVTLYGIAQPVLPAALADPATPLWRTIGSLRAAGWYALAPFLIYGLVSVWKAKESRERRLLILVAVVSWAWIVISAVRGGGDQWDNPRYRTILLPWIALLAAWAWRWAHTHRDAWLGRWLAVEGIFLIFFTEWYASRYTRLIPRLNFWVMVGTIVALSVAVLVGGWMWDQHRKSRPSEGTVSGGTK